MSVGGLDRSIRFFDLSRLTESKGKEPSGHTGLITCASWSPNETQVATGGSDGVICLWCCKSGVVLSTLKEGFSSAVSSVAWSSDGKHICAASAAEDLYDNCQKGENISSSSSNSSSSSSGIKGQQNNDDGSSGIKSEGKQVTLKVWRSTGSKKPIFSCKTVLKAEVGGEEAESTATEALSTPTPKGRVKVIFNVEGSEIVVMMLGWGKDSCPFAIFKLGARSAKAQNVAAGGHFASYSGRNTFPPISTEIDITSEDPTLPVGFSREAPHGTQGLSEDEVFLDPPSSATPLSSSVSAFAILGEDGSVLHLLQRKTYSK